MLSSKNYNITHSLYINTCYRYNAHIDNTEYQHLEISIQYVVVKSSLTIIYFLMFFHMEVNPASISGKLS